MSTYSETEFNLRTTTIRGMTVPFKTCGDIKFNFWSFVVDNMEEHIRYLREDFLVRQDDVFICTFPRSETEFNLRTTTIRGITMPFKPCGDIKFNFWSYVVDDMVEHIRYLREDFVVREDDVFICTFPRSGTNWTHELVQMLLQGTTKFAPLFAFAENFTAESLEKMTSPRVLCTHLPLKFLPPKITEKAKIICVFRNPKDVAVSLHNYILNINFLEYNGPWEEYVKLFLDGDVPCGKWFDHVLDWERIIQENKTASILTLYYEEMKSSLLEHVIKLANFLGVLDKPELFSEIAKKCEFKIQHHERTTNVHEIVKKLTKNTPNFLYRKGEVGDWKNWFTVAQNEMFDKIYAERMKNSTLKLKFTL